MESDPRLGLPSASSFSLTALCPGRQALLKSLGPEIAEPFDEDANRGTLLHKAWEKDSTEGLNSEDTELYTEGNRLVQTAYMQWVMTFNLELSQEGPREHRFWFGEREASGQADRHWFSQTHGLVIDFKSLWAKSLVPSELNWQLLFLAVCAAREYDLEHVRCAFAKPMFKQLDIVDFKPDDLNRAEFAINQVLWASNYLLERRPGPHCRHCKAVTACPEAKAYVLLPSVQSNTLEGITPKLAGDIVETLDLKDCVKIWQTQTSRRNIEDAIKARLKALPAPLQAELGIKLGKPTINRPITNPSAAWSFLMMTAGIPADQLWKAVKMSNGDLADVVQTSLGLSSKKAAETWIREKLSPFITETPQDAPLEQI